MKNARKFANQLLLAGLMIITSFSIADAQRGGGSRGGGGHSFGGGGSRPSFGGGSIPSFGGGSHFNGGGNFSGGVRGGFGGGNRVVSAPRYAPGRVSGGFRGSLNIGIGNNYAYRGGYYNRPYYGRPYGGGYYGGVRFGFGAYYHGYYPHIGFRLNVLPYGYYPFYFGGYPYYYNQGLFYQPYANGGYQVVAPPVGAEIPNLPEGAQEIVIDGNQFFQKDGIYYQPITDESGRRVFRVAGKDGVLNTEAGQQLYDPAYQSPQGYPAPDNNSNSNYNNYNTLPQVGDVVNAVPAGSKKVKINGEKLFVSPDGVYYQEDNSGGSRLYRVVGIPGSDGSADAVYN